ncbi:TasA family protein [Arthrobacter sp. AL12]|uniref:TasA family protein n=1 Tax=Arthrobacter sp. AL12 TaxID=3042241 RepID=UPI00249C645E|nr:TasA family protein [Arthrobacter sp. AL12]MDI3213858.1 TasA family protein [Arthrobacter sp. AL12]
MAQISARTAKWVKWSVVPAALLVSGLAVSQASYSAFSSQTVDAGNNWAAGTVKLVNNAGSAVFKAENLKPGQTGAKCVTVTSTGSLASAVKLYAKDFNTAVTNDLSPFINLVITEGTGGTADCQGFQPSVTPADTSELTLASFGTKSTFANGVGTWAPAGATTAAPVARTYKIAYTLSSTAPDSAQGGTANVVFTWEAQNS